MDAQSVDLRGHGWRARSIRAAALVLAVSSVLAAPAAAQSTGGTSVTAPTAGSVQSLSGPGITLHVPDDGRLNGDGFTADVVGYRFAYQIGLGGSAQQAPSGQVLIVFGVTCSEDEMGQDNDFWDTNGVTARLVVDGSSEPIPTGYGLSSGPGYFEASVPTGSKDVALQLSNEGFSQEFSFTKGEREGLSPYVLYASPSTWQLSDLVNATSVLPTPDPGGQIKDAALDITVVSADLTFFSPASNPKTPADAAQAWLVVNGSGMPNEPPDAGPIGGYLNYEGTLTGNDFHLAIPGHAAMTAMIAGAGGSTDESGQGLFGGTYYFGPVPAATRTATLTIAIPNKIPAQDNLMTSYVEVPVKSQPAPVKLSFPPPFHPAPVAASDNPPPYAPKSSLVSGGGAAGVLVIVVLAGLAVAYVVLRRRRLLPAWATLDFATPAQRRARAAAAWLSPPASAPVPASVISGGTEVATPPTPREAPPTLPPTPPQASSRPRLTSLVPVPEGPRQLPDGTIWVLVLGPPGMAAVTSKALTQPELETACFLACKPGKTFSGEALRSAIGAGRDEDWSARTVITYANGLRRKLGAEHVPDATSTGGYCLVGVSTDAVRFKELAALAKGESDVVQARYLAEALSLVRGAPFAEVPKGTYGWAHRPDSGPSLADELANLDPRDGCRRRGELGCGEGRWRKTLR